VLRNLDKLGGVIGHDIFFAQSDCVPLHRDWRMEWTAVESLGTTSQASAAAWPFARRRNRRNRRRTHQARQVWADSIL
jgi:hypothetical protein